ncbi:MAG TPA: YdeI/OmpD-associated family protein [Candidatus Acidoferrum sp.]|nr:YdeI/OmpD-associated family protein [Candidatus Acidoferrum sp.]
MPSFVFRNPRPAKSAVKESPKPVAKSFKAMLERMSSNLGWVIVRIPLDVPKVWGTRGMLKVKGEINGFAFRSSLFPTGKGYHYLLVNKRMQAGANARAGSVAQFRLEPDMEKRVATVPAELQRILNEERSFRRWFGQLNYSTRKWIADWVTQVKSAEARVRRAEQVAEQLLATMEAERDLPPILKLAFARDPRAFAGWQRMSPSHRRGLLLAIFYYRTPDARDRRIAKMLEDALAFADRKPKKQK